MLSIYLHTIFITCLYRFLIYISRCKRKEREREIVANLSRKENFHHRFTTYFFYFKRDINLPRFAVLLYVREDPTSVANYSIQVDASFAIFSNEFLKTDLSD